MDTPKDIPFVPLEIITGSLIGAGVGLLFGLGYVLLAAIIELNDKSFKARLREHWFPFVFFIIIGTALGGLIAANP